MEHETTKTLLTDLERLSDRELKQLIDASQSLDEAREEDKKTAWKTKVRAEAKTFGLKVQFTEDKRGRRRKA